MNKYNIITIDDFMSTEYVDFSKYVIELRSIPSVIDGLKTSQRKILEKSYQIWKSDKGDMKSMKVFQLGGLVSAHIFYHHGDQSMNDAIIAMSQGFKNNIPYLNSDSQIGSRLVPESGAPRYVSVKLNPKIKSFLKDFELLTYKYEEGYKIEPNYFLPIIPIILVNGSNGIAVAHASDILNRDEKEVIQECINYLNGKKVKLLKPKYKYVTGDFIQDKENPKKWYSCGSFTMINQNTIRITDIPLGYTYESYDEVLDSLVSKEIITSYEDNSKNTIEYIVKLNKSWAAKADNNVIIKTFKLEKPYTENYTLLDENGKLKIFQSVDEILKYFVDFRLKVYDERKKYIISVINNDIDVLENKMKYIQLIVDGKLILNNKKKENIIKDLDKFKLLKIDNSYDYLLNMAIISITKEAIDRLKEKIFDKKTELALVKKSTAKEVYIKELETLKKEI